MIRPAFIFQLGEWHGLSDMSGMVFSDQLHNAFSPNDDGVNDEFQIFKYQDINASIKTYLIVNRWGSVIYKLTDVEFGFGTEWWDGKFKAQKVQEGTFVYYIEIEFETGEVKKYGGEVMIIK